MTNLRTFNPGTISDQAAMLLGALPDPTAAAPLPGPDDLEGWATAHAANEEFFIPFGQGLADRLGATHSETTLGRLPALEITPKGWQENGKRIVYTHGGAYTFLSAASSLAVAVLVADATGQKVLSLDYTVAPKARWQAIVQEVVDAFATLNDQGFAMNQLGAFGDSAGGGLIAGAVLKMRDENRGMPAALALLSPWADITETGDTYHTLKDAEPSYTYAGSLGPSALAYAPLEDQKHPYVSPVYGDYAPGFPPTLIQGGTREIFLSNFVRQYQAIDQAGGDVKLDLYEGMPHVFQALLMAFSAPESLTATAKIGHFFRQKLGI
ncbi:MAG: alpha/beta hydrolase fold domain-containing protein [Alphaproteobacteria bacterium]